jgi:hypothetical protein
VEAGNPPIAELADSVIEEFIYDCLEEIDNYVPAWKFFSITSVKDQQEYDIDSTVLNVVFCDWSGAYNLSDVFDADFNLADIQLYDVETEYYKQVRDYVARESMTAGYGWIFREFDRKLLLLPPPYSGGSKIWYIGQQHWSLEYLPERYEKFMTWYGTSETLKAVARKRRRMSAVSHTGNTMAWSEADPTLGDAQTLMDRFLEAMSVESKKALF